MIDPGPRCYVRYRDYAMAADVFCIQYRGTEPLYLTAEGAWEPFVEGEEPLPIFTLTGHSTPRVLAALAEAISQQGIQPPERPKLEGLYEAQTAHLADLRRLIPELRDR